MRMSGMPASANTAASDGFAQQMPVAPRASCCRAIAGTLCVLACGRSSRPAVSAARCMVSMLRVTRAVSMTTAGVWRSVICTDATLTHEARETLLVDRVARKHLRCIAQLEVARHDFGKDVAEVRGDGEVAPLPALLDLEAGPAAVDLASLHAR